MFQTTNQKWMIWIDLGLPPWLRKPPSSAPPAPRRAPAAPAGHRTAPGAPGSEARGRPGSKVMMADVKRWLHEEKWWFRGCWVDISHGFEWDSSNWWCLWWCYGLRLWWFRMIWWIISNWQLKEQTLCNHYDLMMFDGYIYIYIYIMGIKFNEILMGYHWMYDCDYLSVL